MPYARYTKDPENPVSMIFWGRTRLRGATSLLRFEKGSPYQALIHHLKYREKPEVGSYLGKLLGAEISNTVFASADIIIPVPLHPKKELERGYNQSKFIAEGVSIVTGIPLVNDLLYRQTNTASQTRRNRFERWENMDGVFALKQAVEKYESKSFLLVDDVVTTGSTLEACARELLTIPGSMVFVATVACA